MLLLGFNRPGAGGQIVGDIAVCFDARRRGDSGGGASFQLILVSSIMVTHWQEVWCFNLYM